MSNVVSNLEDDSDIVRASENVWGEINRMWWISTVVFFYVSLKLSAIITQTELPYLTAPSHEDQLLIVLGGLLGYGLISVGVSYLRVSIVVRNADYLFTAQEANQILRIPFAGVGDNCTKIGYVLTGTGVGMIFLAILLMLTTYG